MVELAAWSAVVLAAVTFVFVCVVAVRRVQVARDERRRAEAEERLRPLALALIDGERPNEPLSRRDTRALAALLARYSRQLRGAAGGPLSTFFEEQGAVADACAALVERRPWRRATAAYELGDFGSVTAVPALLRALDDPERDVRAAAARSLGRLGAAEAVEPLVYGLAARRVPRAVAAHALLSIGPAALPALRELEARAESEVRAVAVELVGLLGDASDAPLLVERLHDASAEVRAKAARALGRIGAEEAAEEVRAALSDRIPFVRAAAANALGAFADRADVEALLVAARDTRFEAAQAAARAAARVDRAAVREAAERGDAGPHVAEAADVAHAVRP